MNRAPSPGAASARNRLAHSTRLLLPPVGAALSLRINIVWVFVGNVVYALSQWLILVVLARMGTPEMVGQYAFAVALASPIMLAANLYLRAIAATDARGEFGIIDYWTLRLITTFFGMLLILLIAGYGNFGHTTAWLIAIVGGSKALDALSDLCLGLFQLRGRFSYLGITLGVNGLVSFSALTLAMFVTHDVAWAAFGSLLGSAIALCAVALPAMVGLLRTAPTTFFAAFNGLRPRWHAATLRRLFWRAFPLGAASLRGVLNLYIPRYFIAYYWGTRELGIFAALASLILASSLLTTSLTLSLAPRLAAYYGAGNANAFRGWIVRLLQISVAQGLIGVLVVFVAGPQILSFCFGAEYALETDGLFWLVLTGALYVLTSFLEMGLTALRRFAIQLPIQVFSLGILILLNLRLTPLYGLNGAAIAMFISALCTSLALAAALAFYFRQSFPAVHVSV